MQEGTQIIKDFRNSLLIIKTLDVISFRNQYNVSPFLMFTMVIKFEQSSFVLIYF